MFYDFRTIKGKDLIISTTVIDKCTWK